MRSFKNFLFALLFLLTGNDFLSAGNNWTATADPQRSFIENKGQFKLGSEKTPNGSSVKFAYDGGSTMIYFTPTGISYSFLKRWREKEKESEDPKERAREKAEEREREQRGMRNGKSHAEVEAEEHRMKFKTDVVNMIWEGANPNAQLIALEPTVDYHVYIVKGKDGKEESINNIKAYKKLIYKNLYPNIDVEYIFHPQDGVKYTLILHPGADASNVKMKYSDAVHLTADGEILIQTEFGDIIDHAPITFYSGNSSSVISSKFIKNGKIVSFELGAYDNTRSVTIDPWTQTPTLPNSNGVWECEKDAAGNAYIIGGDSPMKLLKYNAAGTLQWTYNTPWDTANYWLGTLATDNAGNSYVTAGSTAKLQKVSAAGAMIFSVSGGSVDEYWTISFNCDQTRLIVGGTRIQGLPSPTGAGMIFDINTSTGAVIATKKVGWTRTTTIFGFPVTDIEEVRSMTSSFNSRYYYLTLDSIGAIDQNFSACPGSNTLVGRNDGYAWGYKCENYRPNNGNAGVKAIRANQNFVYTHNGANVQKRSLTTGAVITTVAIPGGLSVASGSLNQAGCAGLDIDTCGNVYVGSTNAVIKYDANLVLLSSSATSFRVYDIAVSSGGNIIACGTTGDNSNATRTGYVQQINMTACNAMTLICCNTNVCNAGPFCPTDAPYSLVPGQTGGTWSGPGVNASTGVFSPSVAGPGTHTINYTLACGSGSITVVVTPCTVSPLSACQTAGGQVTVSNGVPTYTWYHQVTTTPCVPGFGTCAGFGTVPGTPVTTWNSFATGSTVTPSGSYPIWVVDGNGDSLQITSLASLPSCTSCPPLTVTPASQVNVNCFGQSTGSFSASTTGGASPYDYTLMNGATTVATFSNIAGSQSFTGLPAGTYTLNVLDNSGCPGSSTITITQPATAVSVSITGSTNASCGASNGTATATATGGSSPYDYVWTGSAGTLQTTNNITGTNTLSGLAAGTYTVTVTDNNNCTTTTTATITSTGGATVSITAQTNVLCFGAATGNATATALGGSSPYDYVWTGSAGTLLTTNNITGSNTLSGLAAGTYTITVTDNAGCTSTATATITQPASAAAVSITGSADASCGASNGSATATATGGTSPYDYVWTGSAGTLQTTNNITGANTLNGLAAGTYTITVTDNNNCTTTATATISNTGGATVSITAQTNVLCFGGTTGDATATAVGGSSPYDYVWTGSAGTLQTTNNIAGPNTLSGLAAGTYTITITDNAGCISTATAIITQPASAAGVSITAFTDASCGASNGAATATATGGSSPYDYVWTGTTGTLQTTNNIAGPNTLSGLAAGTYTIAITDNNNCTTTTTATIANTGGATVSITAQTNVLCFGGTSGDATATAIGGSSPYDYVWTGTAGTLQTTNNIAGPNTLSGLAAGTYTITVTDNAGCNSTSTAIITEPASAVAVSITGTTATPCGASTGTATAQASGGTSPYDYVWTGTAGVLQTTNNITTDNTLSGLTAGTYTVAIADGNGCVTTATASVTSTGGATVSITAQTNVLCFGGTTGDATATAAGGTSPYDYVWTNASGTLQTTTNIAGSNIIDSLAAGTYTVTVTDNGGCVSNATVIITEPLSAAAVAITGTTPAACGTANGSATAQANGGTGPYDYVWTGTAGVLQTTNNISSADVLNSIAAGTYTVTITDNNGCISSTTATVSNSGGATISITAQTNVLCFGGTTGSATANTTGGTSPYDYVWTGSTGILQTTNNISVPNPINGLAAGTYTITVTDNGGCISSATVTITQPSTALALSTASSSNTTCGLNNGSATVSASGGTTGYTYNWLPSGGTGTAATALASGTYTVTVSDANLCTATTTATIGASTGVSAAITAQTNVTCFAGNNGSATVTPSGGTTYTYSWTGGGGTAATASSLAAGTYTVTVTSASCSNTTTVTITQPPTITTAITVTPAICASATGDASAVASGGTGAFTYQWLSGETTSTIDSLSPGPISLTVTDALGCTQTTTAAVASVGSITAYTSPDVTITAGQSTTLNATGGLTYTWSPSTGLSCTTCDSPVASPLQSTTYCVTADSLSCTDTSCVRVNVEIPCPTNTDLAVPNAFSPNGDTHNDIFCLRGWSNCIQTFTIYIYDRWGEKVFESTDADFCWDGTYRGKALDPAVFVYFITATFSNETKVDAKGNISLIR
jgi:gliding motility-associated-like protein